jgi:hypothetical protein
MMQENSHVGLPRCNLPLHEESAFVAAERDALPSARARVSTAQTRGRARGNENGRGGGGPRGKRKKIKELEGVGKNA